MSKNNNIQQKSIVMSEAQQLANFFRIYSGVDREDHGFKDSKSDSEIQDGYPCANCGTPSNNGTFCSNSCEEQIFG